MRSPWLLPVVFISQVWPAFPRESAQPGEVTVLMVSMQQCRPDEAWLEAEQAARTEFESLNLDVEVVQCTAMGEREHRADLGEIADKNNADCAFRILRSPSGDSSQVEIWINDRISGKTSYRLLHTDCDTVPEAARVTALKIVDVLQASLLKLPPRGRAQGSMPAEVSRPIEEPDAGPKEPAGAPEAHRNDKVEKKPAAASGPVVETSAETEEPSGPFGLRLGAGLLTSPGGAGLLWAAQLCLRWEALEELSFELDGTLSFSGQDIESNGARSSFDLTAVRAWVLFDALRQGTWRPSFGLGAGVVVPWSKGVDSNEFLAHTDKTLVAYVGISAQLAVLLTRYLGLRLGARAGLLFPEVRVLFDGEQVAAFGRPMVEGFLDLELRIP